MARFEVNAALSVLWLERVRTDSAVTRFEANAALSVLGLECGDDGFGP